MSRRIALRIVWSWRLNRLCYRGQWLRQNSRELASGTTCPTEFCVSDWRKQIIEKNHFRLWFVVELLPDRVLLDFLRPNPLWWERISYVYLADPFGPPSLEYSQPKEWSRSWTKDGHFKKKPVTLLRSASTAPSWMQRMMAFGFDM